MRSDRSTPPNLSAEQCFALVDQLLVPPMATLGYHSLIGSVNDQPASRGRLTSTGGKSEELPFLWFEFGFEAGSEDVRRLVGPRDPDCDDEWWVNYEPSTGRLELHDWQPVAGHEVDWDTGRDSGPCSVLEVKRRLSAVGQSVSAFVRRHGGHPTAS